MPENYVKFLWEKSFDLFHSKSEPHFAKGFPLDIGLWVGLGRVYLISLVTS